MLKFELLQKTNSYTVSIMGFKVGFDGVEHFDGTLILILGDIAVASIDGELLLEFEQSDFNKEHSII